MALPMGLAAATAFVIDGFIANAVLFDSSRMAHDAANVVLAAAVAILLAQGRRALKPPAV